MKKSQSTAEAFEQLGAQAADLKKKIVASVDPIKFMDFLCAAIVLIAFCGLCFGCAKKDADPYAGTVVLNVKQHFSQPYTRFVMSVYREQSIDTVIKGESVKALSYRRHNLQDMLTEDAGLYRFKQRDSIAVACIVEEFDSYSLFIEGTTQYQKQVIVGDSLNVLSVRMSQFFK